jgi:hypothetical protein
MIVAASQDWRLRVSVLQYCGMEIFWHRCTKRIPELGDVVEGRAIQADGSLVWHPWQGDWVYGCVVALNPMQVHTYNGIKTVCGEFTGRIDRDNSQAMRKGYADIWVVVPLGRTKRGHLANLPKTGFSVRVEK